MLRVIEKVLNNVALRVLVDGAYVEDTPVGKCLATLKQMPNMHFV